MRKLRNNFDFTVFGKAIKAAREEQGISREEAALKMDLAPRYIWALENQGQNPSGQVLVELAQMFDVSVDQYIFPNKKMKKTSKRLQLEKILDFCDDKDLSVLIAATKAILEAKTKDE